MIAFTIWCLQSNRRPQVKRPRVEIGVAVPMTMGAENLKNLFRINHIENTPESFDLGNEFVSIAPKDRSRALRIMIADSKLHPYDYIRIGGYEGDFRRPDSDSYIEQAVNCKVRDFQSCPILRENGYWRGASKMAVEALKSWGPKLFKDQIQQVELTSIKYFPVTYLSCNGQDEVGYELDVYMTLAGKEAKIYGHVWDEGRSRVSFGGS